MPVITTFFISDYISINISSRRPQASSSKHGHKAIDNFRTSRYYTDMTKTEYAADLFKKGYN